MADIKFVAADISTIWDPTLTDHPKFRAMVDMILNSPGCEFDNRSSWLLQMIDEDRMCVDEEADEAMLATYRNCDRTHYSWYLALMHCNIYALVVGVMLSLKYPERKWLIAYVKDHYFCLEQRDSYEGEILIYDLMAHMNIESGMKSSYNWLPAQWKKYHSLRTVEEQWVDVEKGAYDGFP